MSPFDRDNPTITDNLVKGESDVIGIFARCNPGATVALWIDVLAVVVVDGHLLLHMEVIRVLVLVGIGGLPDRDHKHE